VISVRILGPLEVFVGGELVDVPGIRTRAILTRLALDANTTVSVDRLLDDVWGDAQPTNALNALQVRMSQLRLVLGRETVRATRPGYVLVMDPAEVDALAVEVTVARARRLIDHDPELAIAALAEALGRWRGQAFSGIEAPFAVAAQARWEELRLGALEDKLRLDVKAGRALERLPELQELVALHPLREPLHEVLVRAYASLGRQAEALGAYRRVQRQLLEELGIDPGRSLQELESGVLRQDPSLLSRRAPPTNDATRGDGTTFRTEVVPAHPADNEDVDLHPRVLNGNLPRPINRLFHRESDLDAVRTMLVRHPLVTITGPAGVGKTRLAIEIAAQIPMRMHGVWFVGLEATSRADHVAATIAAAVGAPLDQPVASLRARLRGADALLVIDNCEHLGDGPAAVIRELLENCPSVTVMATSQRPLGLQGEAVWPLEPLPRAEALELFAFRVSELNPRVVFDTSTLAAADLVCAALDDLPLAIELAARRCGVFGVAEVAERLSDRFRLLTDRGSARPERHQTLAGAIGWSYDLLFPDAQLLLQIIASFPDGATVEGLEAVAPVIGVSGDDIVDVLAQLVDRSLVVADQHGSVSRYRVLNSIRAFAIERANAEARTELIDAAYATWVMKLASDCAKGMRTDDQVRWLKKFGNERTTINVAFEWLLINDPHGSLELANYLYLPWLITGDNIAAASRLGRALLAAPDADRHLRVRVSACQAVILARVGHHDEAAPIVAWVLANLDGASPHAIALTRSIAGQVYSLAGRIDEALLMMGEARAGLAALGDAWAEAICVLNTALAVGRLGDHAAQAELTNEALELLQPFSDPFVRRLALRNLALVHLQLGNYPAALDSLEEGLSVEQSIGFADEEAATLRLIARANRLLGRREESGEALLSSIQKSTLRGDALSTDMALAELLALHRANDETDLAQSLLSRYRPKALSVGVENLPVALQIQVAALSIERGDTVGADRLKLALAQTIEQNENRQQVLALDMLARIEADDERRSSFLSEADRVAGLAGLHLTERPDRDRR
jgi:predicted ATPase/DNA-binding SARP family transcriptional activator